MNLPVVDQVLHERYAAGAVDDLQVPADVWAAPEAVSTHGWWPPSAEQILGQEPQRRAIEIHLALLVPADTACADKDRWTVDGLTLSQVGGPQDYSHGPWGVAVPLIVYLTRVEG